MFDVWRNTEYLGTLHDIRKAWLFALNEYDYQMQLQFRQGRRRNISAKMEEKGFQLVKEVLYRKMYVWVDDAMIVSLGPVLDSELDTVTENKIFKIVVCDMRILNNNGLPLAGDLKIVQRPEDIDENGPNSFPIPHTKQLAGHFGWSKGHAHIGPESFGLQDGIRTTKPSEAAQADDFTWTLFEKDKVWAFHSYLENRW